MHGLHYAGEVLAGVGRGGRAGQSGQLGHGRPVVGGHPHQGLVRRYPAVH